MKKIVLDMDGTIADLYSVPNWLEKLRAEDETPYLQAKVIGDKEKLVQSLKERKEKTQVGIITWGSKVSSKEYDAKVSRAKQKWLVDNEIPFDFFYCVPYGTDKQEIFSANCGGEGILFDDDKKVRENWKDVSIDPNEIDIATYIKEYVK